MSATEFKAHCLAVLDDVAGSRESVIVTKHGRPVAKIVPIVCETRSVFGAIQFTTDDEQDVFSTGAQWELS